MPPSCSYNELQHTSQKLPRNFYPPCTHTQDQAMTAVSWLQRCHRRLALLCNMALLYTAEPQASKMSVTLSLSPGHSEQDEVFRGGGDISDVKNRELPAGLILVSTETVDHPHEVKVQSLDQDHQDYLNRVRLCPRPGGPGTLGSGISNSGFHKLPLIPIPGDFLCLPRSESPNPRHSFSVDSFCVFVFVFCCW